MFDPRLADVVRPSFARHETFAPRFGWLHKGFDAVAQDPEVFLKENATVTLGVGKNMVNAIRYWSMAFKLTVEQPRSGTSRAYKAVPTWEACWLLSEEGADPYLEDPASLWLLHWWLLAPICVAPTWWIAFHGTRGSRFSVEELTEHVIRQVRLAGWEQPAAASISKDIDCLTKMYAPRRAPKGTAPGSFEDLLDCPFRELGLLEAMPTEDQEWALAGAARASLPAQIIAYTCLDYCARYVSASGSITIARLANEPGGPGRAFLIREPEISGALEEVASSYPQLAVVEALGQRRVVSDIDPRELAWKILDSYYGDARERVPNRAEWEARYPQGKNRQLSLEEGRHE